MNKYFKFTTIIIILLILMPFSAGCNSGDNESKELKGLNSTASTKNLKEATLTFYFIGAEKDSTKKVIKEIEKRTKDSLNIKLKFYWLEDYSYDAVIEGKMAANEPFEALYYNSNDRLAMLEKEGKLKDITKLLPKYAPVLNNYYSKEELESCRVNGKLVALPSLCPKESYCYAVVREDLMKKYDIPEIKNFKDYELYMKTIKEKNPALVPAFFGKNQVNMSAYLGSSSINMFAKENGYAVLYNKMNLMYKWNDPKMKLVRYNEAPEYAGFAKMLDAWKSKNYFIDESTVNAASEEQQGIKMMLSGQIASFIGNTATAEVLNGTKNDTPSAKDYEFKAYELYPENIIPRMDPGLEPVIAFNAKGKNTERALMFMNWIQESQENYDLFMYGIKDQSDDSESLKYIDGVDSGYLGWNSFKAFENLKLDRYVGLNSRYLYHLKTEFSYYSGKEKEKYDKAILNRTKFAPHTGFYLDKSGLLGEFNNLDITPYDDESKKLVEDSMQKIADATQKQLDEWKKAH